MGNDVRVTNPSGTSIYDALIYKNETNTGNAAPAENNAPAVINPEDNAATPNHTTGRVPSSGVSFGDELPPLADFQGGDPNDLSALPSEFTDAPPLPEGAAPKPPSSIGKASLHVQGLAIKSGVTRTAEAVVKGATKRSVKKALTEVVAEAAKAPLKNSNAVIATRVAEGAKKGTEQVIETLAKEGRLGKGVASPTVRAIAKAEGGLVKGLQKSAEGAGEIILKDVAGKGVIGGIKSSPKIIPNTGRALAKTARGAGEKVLEKGLQEGTEAAVKAVLKKAGAETGAKVVTKTVETAAAKAVTKAATEAAAKTSVRAASKLGAAVPIIGAAVGVGITAYDTKDAIEKSNDPTASTASKALAWTTVGLDVVSTGAVATGIGAPIGWVATGLSIGTSIASDWLR